MVRPDLSPRLAHSCLRRLPLLSLGAIAFLLLALTPASPAHAANFYGVWIQASNFDVPGVPRAELDIAGTPYLLLETQDPTTPLNALLWNPTSTISLAPGPNVDVHLCKGFAGMQTATGVQIFAFGNFEVGGVTTRLIMWDGGSWGFAQGPVLGVIPNQIRVRNTATGPELWLAGPVMSFPGIQGLPSIARFDGTQWSSPGLVNGVVTELAIVDEGLPAGESVYLAGDFATAGGIQTQNVARFDGSWSNLAGGVAGSEPLLSVVEFTPGQPEIWLTVTASPTEQALYRWRDGAWDDVTPSLPNGSTGLFGRVASLPTFFGTMVICEKTAFTSEGPRNFGSSETRQGRRQRASRRRAVRTRRRSSRRFLRVRRAGTR